MSGYVAMVDRKTLKQQRIIPVGPGPYWSTSDSTGRYCFVSVARADKVAVLSYKTSKLVKMFPVGDHPQRIRPGQVRATALR